MEGHRNQGQKGGQLPPLIFVEIETKPSSLKGLVIPPPLRIIGRSYGPTVPFYTATMFVRLLGIKWSVRKNYTLTL